jgi:hypothetical protein
VVREEMQRLQSRVDMLEQVSLGMVGGEEGRTGKVWLALMRSRPGPWGSLQTPVVLEGVV